jgi:hypothetical protein
MVSIYLGNLIFSGVMAMSPQAGASTKSVSQYPVLQSTLIEMQQLAAGGASIEYFSYNEFFPLDDLGKCRLIESEEAVSKIKDLVVEVYTETERDEKLTPLLLFQVEDEARALLGPVQYNCCRRAESKQMSLTEWLSFTANDGSYQIQFLTGYED